VPARLEHQARADPVVVRHELEASLGHGCRVETGTTARNHADRVTARMGVDAKKGMLCHGEDTQQ
jgi:hypothetical protein